VGGKEKAPRARGKKRTSRETSGEKKNVSRPKKSFLYLDDTNSNYRKKVGLFSVPRRRKRFFCGLKEKIDKKQHLLGVKL